MRRACLPLFLLVPFLFVLTPPLSARPPEKEALVDRVRQAIDNGIASLKKSEGGRGHWNDNAQYPGGQTALALLALMTAGVDAQDPVIQRGLNHLRGIKSDQTYVLGLQIMVYSLAGEAQDKPRIQDNADLLAKAHQPGGWGYKPGGDPDNSNTQYALLGLNEARLAGAKVDPNLLEAIHADYVKTQQADGGWIYRKGAPGVTMTMTTAGLCGLLISGKEMQQGRQKLLPDGSDPQCGHYEDDKAVAGALAWIGREFPSKLNREVAAEWVSPYYALYGLERAGRLSGERFFGGHDWYRVGCEYLVDIQNRDGSWSGAGTQGQLDGFATIPTSFALLFLAKGRTPVLITKLAHNDGNDWNNKRSDVRHLVDFAARELFRKQPLAWQVFDVRKREAEDELGLAAELLPSPLLWFNGHKFAPRDREMRIVRAYLANGGFVFAEACCGSESFDKDFRKMIKEIYPDSPLVEVPADHPVWSASGRFISSPSEFPLYGIRQGCKWVLFYSPKPIAGYWEANDTTSERGRKAFELGANVIAYATSLERPLPRLTEVAVARPTKEEEKNTRPGYLELAELAHDGDWTWPSKALVNVASALRRDQIDVVLRTSLVKLSPGVDVGDKADALLPNPANAPIREIRETHFFYLHGRKAFNYDEKTLEQLRFALDNNGLLLADAGCGAEDFDAPFRDFIKKLLPEDKFEKIPITDRLYSKELNGTAIDKVKCRRRNADGKAESEMKEGLPELEGIKHNGRWIVVYSRYDIGCALQKHGVTGCLGHDYDSALRLARAAVLYALDR